MDKPMGLVRPNVLSSAESPQFIAFAKDLRNPGRQENCRWQQACQAACSTVGPLCPTPTHPVVFRSRRKRLL